MIFPKSGEPSSNFMIASLYSLLEVNNPKEWKGEGVKKKKRIELGQNHSWKWESERAYASTVSIFRKSVRERK